MKKTLLIAVLLGLAFPAFGAEIKIANYMVRFDVDSTTNYTYCRVNGMNGDPFGGGMPGPKRIKTSGASTDVVSYTASSGAFEGLAEGDIILIDGTTPRVITTYTDADNIVVDTAVTLTNSTFTWWRSVCGTAATSGWIDVAGWATKTLVIQYDQGDLGGLNVRWECSSGGLGAEPVQVYPDNSAGAAVKTYTTAGYDARTAVVAFEPWNKCRIGVKADTSDTSDATTNLELVTGILIVQR